MVMLHASALAFGKTRTLQNIKVNRLDLPQKHANPAARSYLSLTMDDEAADCVATTLENTGMAEFAAKDVVRSSGLSLLGISAGHVALDSAHVIRKEKLSPLLPYRDGSTGRPVMADGCHRLGAIYKFDENAMTPGNIA